MPDGRINVRRGLFRLWIIFACLFAIAVGVASSGGIREEFRKASVTKEMWSRFGTLVPTDSLVPTDCSLARGNPWSDYSKESDGHCWYEMTKFWQ